MMNEAQQKAWSCLTKVEQQSLFLHTSEGKSSWEAGSMMNISHYKYIEIRERSEKFFRMFADFFEKHNSIFRPDCPCERNFQDFIEGVIEHRLKKRDAVVYTGDSTQQITKVNRKNLIRNMKYLKESEDNWDLDSMRLIFEFDRWNNFRILPRLMQAPSAYKRRANEKQKIYIKYLREKFPKWAHKKLIERFKCKITHNSTQPRYWIALVSRELYQDTGYKVFPVKPSEEVITEMSRFFLYVFKDKDDADTFGFMVDKYIDKTSTIPSGQKFWTEFRNVLEEAVNFSQVNNIDFNMKTLDMAYNPRPKKKKSKGKRDKNLEGQQRVKEEQFYQ